MSYFASTTVMILCKSRNLWHVRRTDRRTLISTLQYPHRTSTSRDLPSCNCDSNKSTKHPSAVCLFFPNAWSAASSSSPTPGQYPALLPQHLVRVHFPPVRQPRPGGPLLVVCHELATPLSPEKGVSRRKG